MPPRPYILNELTWKTVRDARYEVAVLPWGATEAHNFHLPYTTDNIETERIAALAAGRAWERGARVVVLPVVPFGVNTLQLDIPLCLNLNPSTQALVLRDLATALAGQGVPKLVILNGHGGNDFRQMVRELQPAVSLFLCTVNWYQVVDPKAFFSELGDHAGELETSVMLHVAAELVEEWADEMEVSPQERSRWLRAVWLHDALRDAPGTRGTTHGGAAADRAAQDGESDRGVLDAVRYHSSGYAGWDDVGKMLYLADFLEPGRRSRRKQRAKLAKRVPHDRDGVLREVVALQVRSRLRAGRTIHPLTVEFWNSLAEC